MYKRQGEFTGYQFTNAIFAKAYENATLFLENGWDLLDTVIQGGRQTGVDVFLSLIHIFRYLGQAVNFVGFPALYSMT